METPEEAGISDTQIAKQARHERGQKLFQIFRQEESEVCIVSSARWETQLKGLMELERRCQDLMQEVELLNDKQEVLADMVVSKRDMQKEAPKNIKRRYSRNSRS